MPEILYTLWQIIILFGDLIVSVLWLAMRWSPVIAWIAFWLFAVNWRKLGCALAEGAWAPVVLLALMSALVWASMAPSEWPITSGFALPNYLWQLVVVVSLMALAGFCGWLQTAFGWTPEEIDLAPAAAAHGHNHGNAVH